MTDEVVNMISERYLELYTSFTGKPLKTENTVNLEDRIFNNLNKWLEAELN